MSERDGRHRHSWRVDVVAVLLILVDWVQVCALAISPEYGWSAGVVRLFRKVSILDISPYIAQAIRNYQTGGTVKDMIVRVPDKRELYALLHEAASTR